MWIIFRLQKFSLRVCVEFAWFFCQFEPGVVYKGVAYTKKRVQYTTDNFLSPIFSAYLQGLRINGESSELINISSLLLHLLFRDLLFVFHQNSVFIIFISFFFFVSHFHSRILRYSCRRQFLLILISIVV